MALSRLLEHAACTTTLAFAPRPGPPGDPSCQPSEVARLLWTMTAVASVVALLVVLRPSWNRVAGLAVGSVVWLWIDMEGPVLVSRGSHGVHLADLPVAIGLAATAVGAVRLLFRARSRGRAD